MKRQISLFASLILGLLVASCQNGMEEMINENAVQEEFATTRAEDESSEDAQDTAIVRPMLVSESEALKEVLRYAQGPVSSGEYIIGKYDENDYDIPDLSGLLVDSIVWSYNTNQFTKIDGSMNSIIIKLINPNSTTDATLTAYFYRNGSIIAASYKSLGVNGPRINVASVQVIGSSDGLQYYPGGYLEANTWYYAYFSCPYSVTPTSWVFSDAQNITYGGNQCHFQTTDAGGTTLAIWGKMSPYNVTKKFVDVTLVGY